MTHPDPIVPPPLGAVRRKVTGRQLLGASWSLLSADRELMALPILSAVAASVAFVLVAAPGVLLFWSMPDAVMPVLEVAWLWVSIFVSTVIAVFFQSALVLAVYERLDGGDPTIGSACRAASGRLRAIVGYSLLAATVGTVLRLIGERGILGLVAEAVGGTVWFLATYLVVPVLVVEQPSPFAAVKRSAHLMVATFGKVARAGLRFGLVEVLVMLAVGGVFVVGFVSMAGGMMALGFAIVALALLVAVGAMVVFSALGTVLNAVLYRYATGLPTPGVDVAMIASSLKVKS